MDTINLEERSLIFQLISLKTSRNIIYPNRRIILIIGFLLAYGVASTSISILVLFWEGFHANQTEGLILPFFRIYYNGNELLAWDYAGLDLLILVLQVVGFLFLILYHLINEFNGKTDLNRILILINLIFCVILAFGAVTMTYPPWGNDPNFFESSGWGLWVGIWIRRWSTSIVENWIHFVFFPMILLLFLGGIIWAHFRGSHLCDQYNQLLFDEMAQEQAALINQLEKSALPIQTTARLLGVDTDKKLFTKLFEIASYRDLYPIFISPNFVNLVKIQYHCQLCKNELSVLPYWQCFRCGRYICQEDYSNLQETTGSSIPTCLDCQGTLVSLPGHCQGCKSYIVDLKTLDNGTSCPRCGHHIRLSDGEILEKINNTNQIKSQKVSSKEFQRIRASKNNNY